MADDEEDDVTSVGWDAIEGALKAVHGDREAMHFGSVLPAAIGGEDPLHGVSVYACPAPTPHFHYVTFGFSELWEKETDDAELSGFGFELTFRLARAANAEEPPTWPIEVLQNLARYVFRTGNAFGETHRLDLNGPIAIEQETAITGVAFARDPQLGELETPHGRLTFLQVVGLTSDEYAATKEWSVSGLLSLLERETPLLITDLDRPSLLDDPETAAEIRDAADREGTAQAEIHGEVARWHASSDELGMTIGANAMADVIRLLDTRLGHGEAFFLHGTGSVIVFEPADEDGWRATTPDGDPIDLGEHPDGLESSELPAVLIVSLTAATATELCEELEPRRGAYFAERMDGMTIEVEPSEIKDREGKVIRTIG